MPQSETSHAGLSLVSRARWHGGQLSRTLASAASVSVMPATGYHAIAQLALDQITQRSK